MKEKLKQLNTEMAKYHDLLGGEEVSYENARDAIRNPDNFVKRIEIPKTIEINPGIFLSQKTIELGGDNFTNVYDLHFNYNDPDLCTEVITKQVPLYPHRIFINEEKTPSKLGKAMACINGAFFFLQDEQLQKVPSEIIYNLNIREGTLLGLPAVKRGAVFTTKDGHVHAKEFEAKGVIQIGSKKIQWIGGEPTAHQKSDQTSKMNDGTALLFNSACCSIEYANPADKTSLRKLRQDLNATPKKGWVVDIVVKAYSEGKSNTLKVSKINRGGGTDFFDGNFILQINEDEVSNLKIGDVVNPLLLDTLEISTIESAMTTGPTVDHFLKNDDHEINHDLSLGSFPPFDPNARYARSVMYKDKNEQIHMVVFDAVPRSQFMKGVTPKEVAKNIPQDVEWSVFLDGGQSCRLTFETQNVEEVDVIARGGDLNIASYGNSQYIRLHERYKTSQSSIGIDHQFLWSRRGRPLSSMIMIRKKA